MNYDVIMIGADPAGQNLACAHNDSGLKIALIEKQAKSVISEPKHDGREIVLMHLSVKFIANLASGKSKWLNTRSPCSARASLGVAVVGMHLINSARF